VQTFAAELLRLELAFLRLLASRVRGTAVTETADIGYGRAVAMRKQARLRLLAAGEVERVARGRYRITEKGRARVATENARGGAA
jgi:predicted transcriptional regulator of viral defense system